MIEPMKVIEVRHVEDCFDGSLIKELLFEAAITKEMIFALGKNEKVQYFADFARPFFKIRVDGLFDLKGIEGNRSMRIHIKNPDSYSLEDFIEFASGII
ncbi:MAG: hypothetical protein JW941_09255 [Candidatus Coatesbacteria bacterium]|nr:hypothetical protein [Candidatus Coatesbacteria bacterium]